MRGYGNLVDTLAELKNAIPSDNERVDINSVNVDMSASSLDRAVQYLSQIKNPYAFRCGNIGVNLMFCPKGKSLKESVHNYLLGQKKG